MRIIFYTELQLTIQKLFSYCDRAGFILNEISIPQSKLRMFYILMPIIVIVCMRCYMLVGCIICSNAVTNSNIKRISGATGDQLIHAMIVSTQQSEQQQHPYPVPVALSPKAYVAWAGFTDEGNYNLRLY